MICRNVSLDPYRALQEECKWVILVCITTQNIVTFRLLDSTNKISALFQRALDIGLTGFALTDHEILSGSVKMIQTYKKLLKEGKIKEDFKIAIGNEIYLIDDIKDYQRKLYKETHPYYHFLLIAKDEIGFQALKRTVIYCLV